MKLQFSSLMFALAIVPAHAGLPEGFFEQCCLRQVNERRSRRELGDFKGLAGYDPELYPPTGIAPLCQTEASSAGTPDDGWTCYDYAEVCANNNAVFFNPISGNPTATNQICANNANCYNPAQADDNCVSDNINVQFPDIWWSCFTAPTVAARLGMGNNWESFHCGFECKFDPAACGDPHFQTFDGKWYDFHGECDMVLLSAEEFGMGLGLDIHVRTKGRYEYSFIESAAVKIGDDILEVSSYGAYAFNGVNGADLTKSKFADMYSVEHVVKNKDTSEYIIRTGGSEYIQVKSFKDLVSVKAGNATAYNFGSSEGMMGDFFQGQMLARDGSTIISNADEFGLEWQVTESDPTLFQTASPVTGKCVMPSERVTEGRRLGASAVNKEAAMKACAHVEAAMLDNCVYDVVATGDLETAKSY